MIAFTFQPGSRTGGYLTGFPFRVATATHLDAVFHRVGLYAHLAPLSAPAIACDLPMPSGVAANGVLG
jgi:hypothetical protein